MKQTAQKSAQTIRVNLLRPQGIPQKLPFRFVQWLLSYGRFIVIIVDVIVLVCFGVRFWYEGEITTTKNKIDNEISSIEKRSSDIALIKSTHQKLQVVQQNIDTTPQWRDVVSQISSKTPGTVQLTALSFEHPQNTPSVQFKITAVTSSESNIELFVNSLKEKSEEETKKKFRDVNLNSFAYENGQITMIISGATR